MEVDFRPSSAPTAGAFELPADLGLAPSRSVALEEYAALELPSTGEELWRYTDVSFLAEGRRALPEGIFDGSGYARPASLTPSDVGIVAPIAPLSGLLGIHDGVPGPLLVSEELASSGVTIDTASAADEIPSDVAFSLVSPRQDKFTALVAAVGPALVVRFPDGVVIDKPLLVSISLSPGPRPTVVPTHLVVETGKDSKLAVVVHYSGSGARGVEPSLSLPVTEISVGDGSKLEYLVVQELGRSVCHIETSRVTLGSRAWLSSTVVALGAGLARHRMETAMAGEYAESEMLGIYFGDSDQHVDFRTLQDHQAPRTVSDLLYKGAVTDRATAVYAGLVRVEKDAQKISGFQTNKNLVLSEDASAESIPTLEILANDVRCSHASSIGPVDEEEIYYLESRGIDPVLAEQLIVEGFFEEAIERIPLGAVAGRIRSEISRKFASREV